MHFPWKKVRSTRLSRLVNDHLHNSQKRRDGSSLVVETGFPTSLVDLYIKNREKLKNWSKKKRRSSIPLPTPLADDILYLSCPPPAPAPSPMSPLSSAGSGSPAPSVHFSAGSSLRLPLPLPLPLPSPSGEVNGIIVDAKEDFMVILKMVLVVCFAVGSKRLAVGITLSAVLLFLLEYVGRHACRLWKASSGGEGLLRLMVQRICVLLRFRGVKFDEILMPDIPLNRSLKSGSCMSKSESKCLNQEIQSEYEAVSGSCLEERITCEEIESEAVAIKKEGTNCEVVEFKISKSRSANIRSKMKKFFSEKLTRSRKGHDGCPQRLVEEEQCVFMCDEQETFLQCSNEAESKEEDDICAFGGLTEIKGETVAEIQQKDEEIKGGLTWKQLVLCLIVLTGLIGGRAFALLFTLSSCLLFKLSETLSRHMKLPVIRYSSN